MSDLYAKRKLFGTDGVRGVVNENFDPFFAVRLALATASYFPEGSRVLVGCDARVGNPAIYNAILSALAAGGSKVYDAGYAPTPAIQLAVRDHGFDYGVVVTASHNPPQWVGFKLILSDGIEAPVNVELEVERIFFEMKFRRMPWYGIRSIERFPIVNDYYVEQVKKHVDVDRNEASKIKVVADCANSVSALTTPRILKELGAKVLSVNADLGIPYRPYEPTPEHLEDTAKIVQAVGADFGVTHDGDGDRAIFIDPRGRVIPGDVSAIMLINYIAEEKRPDLPKKVVTAISTSHFLMDRNVAGRGIEVVWTRVGFVNIARKIVEIGGAIAGFEDNGGFGYVPHQPVRDGGMSAALMLELLTRKRVRLDELFDSIPKPVIIRTKVPLPDRSKVGEVYKEVKSMYSGEIIEIDGVKVISKDYAFLVRPSGTEPLLRIMVESWSRDTAEKICKELVELAKKILGV